MKHRNSSDPGKEEHLKKSRGGGNARKHESSQRKRIKSRELFEVELCNTYCQEMSDSELDLFAGNWLKSHSLDWLNGKFLLHRHPSFLDSEIKTLGRRQQSPRCIDTSVYGI